MNIKNLTKLLPVLVLALSIAGCGGNSSKTANESTDTLPLDSIKAIAHDAYIYGYPMVDNYRVEYAYYVQQ